MADMMTFPDTVEEFMDQYKITDTEHIYTNGAELVPIFRMKQWFDHKPEQRWIPVGERLPEDDTEVLVYLFDRTSPYIAWVTDCCWFTEDFEVEKENYPTAWMPLPEPYQEGYQEGEQDENR